MSVPGHESLGGEPSTGSAATRHRSARRGRDIGCSSRLSRASRLVDSVCSKDRQACGQRCANKLMAFQLQAAASACKGVVMAGRRCRHHARLMGSIVPPKTLSKQLVYFTRWAISCRSAFPDTSLCSIACALLCPGQAASRQQCIAHLSHQLERRLQPGLGHAGVTKHARLCSASCVI